MTTDDTALRPLTPKQDAFALYLFQGLSQRDAYLKAGYSATQLPGTIDRAASALASAYKIHTRVRELQAQAESDAIGTVTERKKRLTEIYRANLTDFVDNEGNITLKPSAALAEVVIEEHIVDQEHSLSLRTKRLKVRDPVAAIAEQNKMERIGAGSELPPNINIVFVVGKGYRDLPQLAEGNSGNSD